MTINCDTMKLTIEEPVTPHITPSMLGVVTDDVTKIINNNTITEPTIMIECNGHAPKTITENSDKRQEDEFFVEEEQNESLDNLSSLRPSASTVSLSLLRVREQHPSPPHSQHPSPPHSPLLQTSFDFPGKLTNKPPVSPKLRPRIRKSVDSDPSIYGRAGGNTDSSTQLGNSFQSRVKNWVNTGSHEQISIEGQLNVKTDRLSTRESSEESLKSISPYRRRRAMEYSDRNRSVSISIDKDEEIRILQIEIDKFRARLSTLEELMNKKSLLNSQHLSRTSSNDILNENLLTDSQKVNKDRVYINIGGVRHETYRSTLKNIPDTRLSWIAEESATHSPEYDPTAGEFFFDRHPQVFSHILNYYRTGNLHVPYDVCGPLFEEELNYWGIDDSQVESCCWLSYRQHRDAQDTLKDFEGIELEKNYDDDSEPDLSKYGFDVSGGDDEEEKVTCYRKWQPVMWKLMEDPYSSKKAKVVAYISMILIMVSVVLSCLETVDYFKSNDQRKTILLAFEGCCVFYFTIELSIRFIFCPDKIAFLKGILNWIDFMAILPFFVQVIMQYGLGSHSQFSFFIQSIRVIRVFRIIKLSKHSVGLQILGHTLKASFRELLLLIFFLAIGVVIFSSLAFYCEHGEPNTKFSSIPATFWWAVITMTTVGYGDMVPMTTLGKCVGTICSVCGVLMIALPVPVIVNNFNLYYSHAQARLKLPKKKRRVLVGAANALKVDDMNRRPEHSSSESSLNQDPEDGSDKSDTEGADKFQLRMKRFSRRDSNMFGSNPNPSPQSLRNGDIAVIHKSRNNTYAMSKRRSLLPTIPTLPEIEQ